MKLCLLVLVLLASSHLIAADVPSILVKPQSETKTGDFVLSTTGGTPTQTTSAAVSFDSEYLWVNFVVADTSIYSPYSQCNEDLYTADTVECFVAPATSISNSNGVSNYLELEVSPYGVLFVANVTNSNGECSGIQDDLQNCSATGIVHKASVCSSSEQCSGSGLPAGFVGYTVELGVPWSLLHTLNAGQLTSNWRMGLFRIDRANAAASPPTQYQAWSPDYYNPACFHVPAYFGYLTLSEPK